MREFTQRKEDEIIQAMKIILLRYERKRNFEKITRTALYETLLAEGVLDVNSKEAFDALLSWAIETRKISDKGIRKFTKRKGAKSYYFLKEQLSQLFEAADRPKVAIACYLTLICGLRISEVCNLRLKDLDLESIPCKVYIRNAKNSRRKYDGYGKDRIVQFHPELKAPLEKWKEIIGDTSEWFLPSMTHPSKPMRKKSLHEQYRQLLEKSKLLVPEYSYDVTQLNRGEKKTFKVHRHKYYFHTLRHTYAQIWREKGGDRDTLQAQLGHSDPATTQKYYDTTEEQIGKDIQKVFGTAKYPVTTSTIREPPKEPRNDSALEMARLEYEKKKLELEILKEQNKGGKQDAKPDQN